MSHIHTFADRTCVIATMHHKEQIIAPLLEERLRVKTLVPTDFNTDQFGTFTREIARTGDQEAAALAKAKAALTHTSETLACASEGSFGPHPAIPFVTTGVELVVLYDATIERSFSGCAYGTTTNLAHARVSSLEEVKAFADRVGFPAHGVILRPGQSSHTIYKECYTFAELEATAGQLLRPLWRRSIFLETDMRAHRNPTRQEGIKAATFDLLLTLSRTCPACDALGYRKTKPIPGARCTECSGPTDIPYADMYLCDVCSYTEERPRPVTETTPGNCPRCNP